MTNRLMIAALLFAGSQPLQAQDNTITRIARISIDSAQSVAYRKLLQEQMETAIRVEPGVLGYTVYADKAAPYRITIVELYADSSAYLAHREAPHFKKYKAATKDMVKSLELSEVNPILALKKETDF